MRQISAPRLCNASRAVLYLISMLLAFMVTHAHATTISTVAGNGQSGYAASNVPATSTGFTAPCAIATDTLGNFYVADYLGHVVRRIDSKGIISTVVGNSRSGYTPFCDHGDGATGFQHRPNSVSFVHTELCVGYRPSISWRE